MSNNYFYRAGDLTDDFNSVENLKIVDELIFGYSNINDLRTLEIFLKLKKEQNISATSFLYAFSLANVIQDIPVDDFVNNMINILNVEKFDISGNKMGINGFKDLNQYDYRITMSNSNNISFSDVQTFLEKFNLLAKTNKLSYGLKFEPNTTDLIILYLKETDLERTVNILEDLKNNEVALVSKFGRQKPFTTSIGDSQYYGVSMGSSKMFNTNMKGFFSLGTTFTEYTARLLESSYNELVNKYQGYLNYVTSVELYNTMLLNHKRNYGYDLYENIPLWMNKENYESYCKYKINYNENCSKSF